MHARNFVLPAALLLSTLSGTQPLGAAAIFDNLSEAGTDYRIAYQYPRDGLWGETAQSFSTGGSAYELNRVTLYMAQATPGSLVVALHAAGAGVPGAEVATLSILDPLPSFDMGQVRFDGTGISLAANATYWIVMRPASGNYMWGSNTNPLPGTGLTRNEAVPDWWPGPIDALGYQIMRIDADAVGAPEPSALLLALPALAFCLRRRAAVRPIG
jgi:hypothetical protein